MGTPTLKNKNQHSAKKKKKTCPEKFPLSVSKIRFCHYC